MEVALKQGIHLVIYTFSKQLLAKEVIPKGFFGVIVFVVWLWLVTWLAFFELCIQLLHHHSKTFFSSHDQSWLTWLMFIPFSLCFSFFHNTHDQEKSSSYYDLLDWRFYICAIILFIHSPPFPLFLPAHSSDNPLCWTHLCSCYREDQSSTPHGLHDPNTEE